MTTMGFCDQCDYHHSCHCEQPVMPEHDNPETGEHCPGSGRIGLTGLS